MKVTVFRVKQARREFFVFVMNSKKLLEWCYVIRRSEDPKKGIQRIVREDRLKEISEYIKQAKDTIFPNSIVLDFSHEVKFFPSESQRNVGCLRIPEKKDIAQVIDGQHRLYGVARAKKHFDLPVVAFIDLNVKQRASIFLTINSKQKGVNTSLVYDLFGLTRTGAPVELLAIDLAKSLHSDPDSPWKGLFKMTDARAKKKESLSLAAFVSALKKILKNKDNIFSNLDFQQQLLTLKNYFNAIHKLFPTQWTKKEYILIKTTGFNGLMKLFPRVHLRCILEQDVLCNNVYEQIKQLRGFDFSSKEWKGVTGEAGAQLLANELERKLKPLKIT